MNSNIKKRWIKALRSKKYSQGVLYLENKNKFCCLGVLCSLLLDDNIVNRNDTPGSPVAYNGSIYDLPSEVCEAAGLSELGYIVLTPKAVRLIRPYNISYKAGNIIDLSLLNDNGVPFNIIADIIEECL